MDSNSISRIRRNDNGRITTKRIWRKKNEKMEKTCNRSSNERIQKRKCKSNASTKSKRYTSIMGLERCKWKKLRITSIEPRIMWIMLYFRNFGTSSM
mmetsp:Transcript_110686/g.263956  ORF Transcript_110686/g.263956 Transcript_110686/m.263956 type:complete len:97 (+) Transcript_110686:586-876(+)